MPKAKRSAGGLWHVVSPAYRNCGIVPTTPDDEFAREGTLAELYLFVSERTDEEPAEEACPHCNWGENPP